MTRWRAAAVVVILLFAIYHAASLFRFPDVHGDEAAEMLHAVSTGTLMQNHRVTDGAYGAPFEFLNRNQTETYRPGYSALLKVVFQFAGIGFLQARALSLAAALVIQILVYISVSIRHSERTALLALIFLACEPFFSTAAHTARPEMVLSAAVVSSFIGVWVAIQRQRLGWALSAGVIAGLSPLLHPNGILGVPALFCVSLIAVPESRQPWKTPFVFCLGAFLGLIAWARAFPLDQLVMHRAIWKDWGLETPMLHGASLWKSFQQEWARFIAATPPYGVENPSLWRNLARWQYAGFGLAGLWAFTSIRLPRFAAPPIIMIVTLFLAMAAMTSHKNPLYIVLLLPYFAFVLPGLFGRLVSLQSAVHRRVALALFGVWLSGTCISGVTVVHAQHRSPIPYERVCANLRSLLPAGSRVLGRGEFWACRQDWTWLDANVLTFQYWLTGSVDHVPQAIERLHPDFLFLHPALLRMFLPLIHTSAQRPFILVPVVMIPGQNPEEPHWLVRIRYKNMPPPRHNAVRRLRSPSRTT